MLPLTHDFRDGSKTEVAALPSYVCVTPQSRHQRPRLRRPFRANYGHARPMNNFCCQCSIGARCRPERPAGQNEGGTHPSNFKPSGGTHSTTTSRILAKPSGSLESLIS